MADRQVRRRLSEEEMNRGIGMLEAGLSQMEVARVLGVSQSIVSRMWTRFHLTGNVMHQHAGGRERSTTRAQDRFITRDHFLARFRDILAFFCKKSHQNSRSEKKNRTLNFSHFAPLSFYFAHAVHFETIGLFCLTGF